MLNREKHRAVLGQILKDIAQDPALATVLGFKGGTAAALFHGLPRFSVDLDFDLLIGGYEGHFQDIQKKISTVLQTYGTVRESTIKRYTLFSLLSYGEDDHNIKVEISTRLLLPDMTGRYEALRHLGLSLLVAKRSTLFAGKLAALTERRRFAMRDVFDAWFFAKNLWDLDEELLSALTGRTLDEQIRRSIERISTVKENEVLQGLGELVSESEKEWIRKNLCSEAIALLENYRASVSSH